MDNERGFLMNGFKRILALSLTVLMLSSFAACQVFKSEDETTKLSAEDLMTLTGIDGTVPTDFEGNTIADDAKSEIDDFNNKEEVLVQNSGTTKKADAVNNTTKNNSTTKNNGGESATLPNASNFNKLNQEFFAKGIFTIEGTMSASFEGQNMSLPFKLARNGKKQYIRTQYTYQNFTIGMIVNNENTYILLPDVKLYQPIEENLFGDADYSGLTDVKTHASTKRVKIGDDIYVCEEIKGSDGYSTFFYFSEETGELKRIKFQDADGESLLKVSKIKPTVDESEFAIPKGYKKADIENLG